MLRALPVAEVIALMEESTQALPQSLGPDSRLVELSGWDSMGMVMFMGLVRDQCGVELSVYDLRECATVRDLAAAIERQAAR